MKNILIGLMVLFFGSSLNASTKQVVMESGADATPPQKSKNCFLSQEFPKKIIFGNYSEKPLAQALLKKFQEDALYEKINALAQENGFIVHMRPLLGYNILVIEPILSEAVHNEVMEIMKPQFQDIYSVCAKKVDPKLQTLLDEQVKEVASAEVLLNETNTSQESAQQEKRQSALEAEKIREAVSFKEQIKDTTQNLQEQKAVSTPTEEVVEESLFMRSLWVVILGVLLVLGVILYPRFAQLYSKN